jgi:hypothetical protein
MPGPKRSTLRPAVVVDPVLAEFAFGEIVIVVDDGLGAVLQGEGERGVVAGSDDRGVGPGVAPVRTLDEGAGNQPPLAVLDDPLAVFIDDGVGALADDVGVEAAAAFEAVVAGAANTSSTCSPFGIWWVMKSIVTFP